uniref:CNH domain-containing protein n=1 Tax=Haemonchus contortus TaxID=6289 RepID=A0A7I4Z6Y5_HAECO
MSGSVSDVEKFELTICCEVAKQLKPDEEIIAIGGSSSVVFLGTNTGHVIHIKKQKNRFKVAGSFELPTKQAIRQIEFASALGVVLVLCENILFDFELESFEIVSNRTSVQCIAVNTNPIVDDPFCLQIAVATTSKHLQFCERRNGKMEVVQKLSTEGNVSAMAFSRLTICFAANGMYSIYNITTKSVIPLFPFDPQVIRPQICCVDMEFLVAGMDGLLISVTEQGVSIRPPTVIPSTPVDAMVCCSPYVYIRASDDIMIVSLENARISQCIKAEHAKVLSILDGLIFVATNQVLYNVSMISLEKQVDALFTHGDYDEAISLYQAKLNRSFDVDSLVDFIKLKKKIAFRYVEERKFEKAAELLVSTEVNPDEVISLFEWPSSESILSNNVEDSDGYQFLEEYLLHIRDLHFAQTSRASIDTSLLKLFTINHKLGNVFRLDNFHPNYEESADFLESTVNYNYAAEMWLLAGDAAKAWDIWRRLCCGELEDITFNIDDIIERVSSITDKKLLQDVLTWMIPVSPERCMKIIVATKILDHMTVREMLSGDAKLLRLYLESIPFCEEVAKELCDIYIEDIKAGDLSCRHRFRRLLLKMSVSDRSAVYDKIPAECGVERLLCDSSQSAGDILDKVVKLYHDYDAAELICSHYSPTQPDICLNLLKFLEDRGSEFAAVDGAESRICSLLKCMGDAVDPSKVISVLPESTAIDQVSYFLMRSVAKKQQEQYMLRYKESLLERCAEMEKYNLPNEKIVIEDKAVCAVCNDPISCNDVLCYLKTGYVVHSKCMKYENLCPLTNSLLVPPE